MEIPSNGLTYVQGCMCAGSGCAGHVTLTWQYPPCSACGQRSTVVWGGAWMNDVYSCDVHGPFSIYSAATALPPGFYMRSLTPLTGPAPYSTGHLGLNVPRGTFQ